VGLIIPCREASRLLSQSQDGSLPLAQWVRLRLHLAVCEACTRFARQLRLLQAAMQRYRQ
jgi:Putative zinc-finger